MRWALSPTAFAEPRRVDYAGAGALVALPSAHEHGSTLQRCYPFALRFWRTFDRSDGHGLPLL